MECIINLIHHSVSIRRVQGVAMIQEFRFQSEFASSVLNFWSPINIGIEPMAKSDGIRRGPYMYAHARGGAQISLFTIPIQHFVS